ncbi:hypothetical protein FSW04_08055 [Baekduia soli]|uniref:OmpA family protein n=1 Tax=Baekduia soli TaxID=496014 RepID=A0A5B8U3A7_9ACTN|nr:hypothetical protein FSW04_08055 [Baekduia soli]
MREAGPAQRAAAAPERVAPAARILALQRSAGNAVVAGLARRPAPVRSVLARDPTPAPAPPAAPTVVSTQPAGDHQVLVTLDDGARYRVTRRVKARRVTDPGAPKVTFHGDKERVWMRVSWCEGTKGSIDVGADPQGAAEQVLQRIGKELVGGGSMQRVIDAVEGAELKPFVKVDVAASGSWRVTGDVSVTVNRNGVPGFDSGVTLRIGSVSVKGDIGGSNLGDDTRRPEVHGGIKIEIPLDPVPKHTCQPRTVDITWEYTCERERDVQETVMLQPPDIEHHDPASVFVYFPYRSDAPELDRSAEELHRLDQLAGAGYRVLGVDGYASPEGPQDPRPDGSFPGNRALSQKRADAAMAIVRARARPDLMRFRTLGVAEGAASVGRGEKYPLRRKVGTDGVETEEELTGNDLEQPVVDTFTADPEELGRVPERDRERIAAARSTRAKAQLIYPWLRRAEIRLRHDWTEHPDPVPHTQTVTRRDPAGPCPAIVGAAADRFWGEPARTQ